MDKKRIEPPAMLVWWIALWAPPGKESEVQDDLIEKFTRKCQRDGSEAAMMWLNGQAIRTPFVTIRNWLEGAFEVVVRLITEVGNATDKLSRLIWLVMLLVALILAPFGCA